MEEIYFTRSFSYMHTMQKLHNCKDQEFLLLQAKTNNDLAREVAKNKNISPHTADYLISTNCPLVIRTLTSNEAITDEQKATVHFLSCKNSLGHRTQSTCTSCKSSCYANKSIKGKKYAK